MREQQMTAERAIQLPEPWRSADVLVVLPTYQEAANLPVIVAVLFNLPLRGSGSRSMTTRRTAPAQIAEELAERYGRRGSRSFIAASKDGVRAGRLHRWDESRRSAAGAEFVVQMDATCPIGPSTCRR